MKSYNFDELVFFSKLIRDYLSGDLKSLGIVDWNYSLEQINSNKKRKYASSTREIVSEVINKQYEGLLLTEAEQENLRLFAQDNCHSITTGHQLVLLGGPLFFYTKIKDVIRLCKEISTSESPVVPFFWMASEDHDFEEISKVNLFGKELRCEGENKGPVGRISKNHFSLFLEEVNLIIGDGEKFQEVKSIINHAFNNGGNLSQITRLFVRELFKDEGILILDADDKNLKALFTEYASKELKNSTSYKATQVQIEKLKDYKIQVNPREINLFYIENEIRKRIVKTTNGYSLSDNSISWNEEEIMGLVKSNPEKISPNVILRPLYQEVLLPNLAYVGGAGEIAYWLELSEVFKEFNVDFPIPIVRNSYFVLQPKLKEWLDTNNLELSSFFGELDILINNYTTEIAGGELSFEDEKAALEKVYKQLLEKGKLINPQLEKVVLGEQTRAMSALENVYRRFLNAEKQNQEQSINKLKSIHSKLFPNGVPMERVGSFLPYIANQKETLNEFLNQSPSVFEKKISILFL